MPILLAGPHAVLRGGTLMGKGCERGARGATAFLSTYTPLHPTSTILPLPARLHPATYVMAPACPPPHSCPIVFLDITAILTSVAPALLASLHTRCETPSIRTSLAPAPLPTPPVPCVLSLAHSFSCCFLPLPILPLLPFYLLRFAHAPLRTHTPLVLYLTPQRAPLASRQV